MLGDKSKEVQQSQEDETDKRIKYMSDARSYFLVRVYIGVAERRKGTESDFVKV